MIGVFNMLKLTINQFEKKRLLFYAEQTLSESLHWGDGAVIIPEEQILLDAIKENCITLVISFHFLCSLLP